MHEERKRIKVVGKEGILLGGRRNQYIGRRPSTRRKPSHHSLPDRFGDTSKLTGQKTPCVIRLFALGRIPFSETWNKPSPFDQRGRHLACILQLLGSTLSHECRPIRDAGAEGTGLVLADMTSDWSKGGPTRQRSCLSDGPPLQMPCN